MTCEMVNDLVGLYALGALDETQQLALDAHLDGCNACWTSFAEMRQVVGIVAYGLEMPPLSAHVKERLFSRIDRQPVRPEPRQTRPLPFGDPAWLGLMRESDLPQTPPKPWRLAIGLAVAILAAGYQYSAATRVRAEFAAANERLAKQETLLQRSQALVRTLQQDKQDLSLLKAKDVQLASLAGQRRRPGATAQLAWSRQENSWLLNVERLAPAAAPLQYQLWAVTARSNYSLGTFQTKRDGKGLVKAFLPTLDGKPVAALVTIEPAGGVAQPTGDLMLMGLL